MMVEYIMKMFEYSFSKEWYESYWAFDLHGTIIKPTYKGTEVIYYPYAKESLQLLTNRKDIKMILWTSSYPYEISQYMDRFSDDKIRFDSINENPGISSNNGNFGFYEKKFYFNILFDDKANFDPEIEWKEIYNFLINCEQTNYLPNPKWTTKY